MFACLFVPTSVCLSFFRSVCLRVYCVCYLKISVSAAFERIFKLLAKNRVAVKLSRPIATPCTRPLSPRIPLSPRSWCSHRPQKLDLNILAFSINSRITLSGSVNMNSHVQQQAALLPASRNVACHDINSEAQQQPSSLAAVVQLCGKAFDQGILLPSRTVGSHFQSFMRQSVPATFPHVRLLNFPYAAYTLHSRKETRFPCPGIFQRKT